MVFTNRRVGEGVEVTAPCLPNLRSLPDTGFTRKSGNSADNSLDIAEGCALIEGTRVNDRDR